MSRLGWSAVRGGWFQLIASPLHPPKRQWLPSVQSSQTSTIIISSQSDLSYRNPYASVRIVALFCVELYVLNTLATNTALEHSRKHRNRKLG